LKSALEQVSTSRTTKPGRGLSRPIQTSPCSIARRRAALAPAIILLVAADGEAMPFRDGAFAEAIVGLAMCTIPHPERALAELQRTLSPSGTLRLLEHVRFDNALLGRLQDWMTPIWRRLAGGCRLNRRTAQMVAASGLFKIESIGSHLGGYVQSIVAVRASGRGIVAERAGA
jgi:SAM-dependent methyltransferase